MAWCNKQIILKAYPSMSIDCLAFYIFVYLGRIHMKFQFSLTDTAYKRLFPVYMRHTASTHAAAGILLLTQDYIIKQNSDSRHKW